MKVTTLSKSAFYVWTVVAKVTFEGTTGLPIRAKNGSHLITKCRNLVLRELLAVAVGAFPIGAGTKVVCSAEGKTADPATFLEGHFCLV